MKKKKVEGALKYGENLEFRINKLYISTHLELCSLDLASLKVTQTQDFIPQPQQNIYFTVSTTV